MQQGRKLRACALLDHVKTVERQLAEVGLSGIGRQAAKELRHVGQWPSAQLPKQLGTTHPHAGRAVADVVDHLVVEDEG